jgi:hypothetical protein
MRTSPIYGRPTYISELEPVFMRPRGLSGASRPPARADRGQCPVEDQVAYIVAQALDELHDYVDEASHAPWPESRTPPRPFLPKAAAACCTCVTDFASSGCVITQSYELAG